uniref:N-acetyltransferase domain-containing protein n=1 Tax=viral metagenome TaxID=1070528 RepID=A0A6C0EIH9_9ZZZZ
MNIEINEINKIDIERLVFIGEQCLPIFYDSDSIEYLLNTDGYLLYKILLDNLIIGYCFIENIEDRCHILSIAILKEYRNKGIGGNIIEYIKLLNKNKISLYVHLENKKAIRFYNNNGFIVKKLLENYYENFVNPSAYYLEYNI